MVGKQPHSVEDGLVCPAERPGWNQSNQFEAALASPARRSTRPLRRVVAWAGPGAGAGSLWPAWACSCVYGILGSCPPLPDNQASARARTGGVPGGDDTRTPLTRIRTSINH